MEGSITQYTNLQNVQVFQAFPPPPTPNSMWAYYIGKPIDKLVDCFYKIKSSNTKEIFDELTRHILGLNNRLLIQQNLS